MITQSEFISKILPHTLKYEGGFANVRGDAGGLTYRGITKKNNPNWAGWATVERIKPAHNQIIKELEPLVAEFYWNRFKNNYYHCLNSVKVGLMMFDFNVHGGMNIKTIIKLLKTKFNKTFEKPTYGQIFSFINSLDEDKVSEAIINYRKEYLQALINRKPEYSKFKEGWFSRIDSLKSFINIKTVGISAVAVLAVLAAVYFLFFRKESANVI